MPKVSLVITLFLVYIFRNVFIVVRFVVVVLLMLSSFFSVLRLDFNVL